MVEAQIAFKNPGLAKEYFEAELPTLHGHSSEYM